MHVLKKLLFASLLFTSACNSSEPTAIIDRNNLYSPAILESTGLPATDTAPEIISLGETLSPAHLSVIGDKANNFLFKNTQGVAIFNLILHLENAPDSLIIQSYCPDSLGLNEYCRFSIQNGHEATIPSNTRLVVRASMGSSSGISSISRLSLYEVTKNRANLTAQIFPSTTSVTTGSTFNTRLHLSNTTSVAIRDLALMVSASDYPHLLFSSEACYSFIDRYSICLIQLNPNEQKDINFEWRAGDASHPGLTGYSNIQFILDSPDFINSITQTFQVFVGA